MKCHYSVTNITCRCQANQMQTDVGTPTYPAITLSQSSSLQALLQKRPFTGTRSSHTGSPDHAYQLCRLANDRAQADQLEHSIKADLANASHRFLSLALVQTIAWLGEESSILSAERKDRELLWGNVVAGCEVWQRREVCCVAKQLLPCGCSHTVAPKPIHVNYSYRFTFTTFPDHTLCKTIKICMLRF
jgi:hypothetical protein